MQSPIGIIPYDVLSNIFSVYALELHEDPIVLTHVCRVWRHLARDMGTLWTEINLQVPARARHNLEMARTSPLNVLWFNHNYKPGVYRSVDDPDVAWVWPYAPRFAEFILSHTQHIVDSVFKKLPQHLPELTNLVVLCQSVQIDVVPTRIRQSMPYLRHIQLSYMSLHGEDLLRVFRESTSLQKVELLHPCVMLPANGVTQEKESIPLPYLRVFSITDVDTKVQRYLMKPLIFPPRCTITAVRDSQNFQTDPILDLEILNRFRPLQIAELERQETLLDLTEHSNDKRASLRLVSTHNLEDVDCQSVNGALGLSSLRTLTFSGSMPATFLRNLLQCTSSVTNIVIKKTRTAQHILLNMTPILGPDLLPNFNTLELCGVHFDANILMCAEDILEHFQSVGREIQTLLLRRCHFDEEEEILSTLGELVGEIRIA